MHVGPTESNDDERSGGLNLLPFTGQPGMEGTRPVLPEAGIHHPAELADRERVPAADEIPVNEGACPGFGGNRWVS